MPVFNGEPYLKFLRDYKGFNVFEVNGLFLRKTKNIEFSNCEQHERFNWIPEFEIWIDENATKDEVYYYSLNQFHVNRLMKQGKDFWTALKAADKIELAERHQRDNTPLVQHSAPDEAKAYHQELIGITHQGIQVWLVDGPKVRAWADVDFYDGSNGLARAYTPKNEFWIDSDLVRPEWPTVLYHEGKEFDLMSKLTYHSTEGAIYDKCHEVASRGEHYLLNHPSEVKPALSKLGIDFL